ncbi:unnamed protein product [Phytomonas sp. EM1]|nr:unnamed protein product [Phytomonas sp. EM1]|eukprot:CCW61287.1 unnamed protein product [Phytomonas sp. isolate EM1]
MGSRESIAPEELAVADEGSRERLLGGPLPVARRLPARGILLFVILSLNFILYFDRGAVVGSLMAIRADAKILGARLALTDAQSGLLFSGFIVGYMLSCPLFVALAVRFGFKRVILISLSVWASACIATALAWSYGSLLGSRLVAGVGEAAFISFAMTTTDNIAPVARRTTWIGAFYAMVPLGMAVGIAIGGFVGGKGPLFAGMPAWRGVFLAEVGVAIPILALFALVPSTFYKKPSTEGEREGEAGSVEAAFVSLPAAFTGLLRNADYALLIAGFCVFSFVATALSVWGIPMLMEGPLRLEGGPAAALIGGATALCGVGGALLGGGLVDLLGGSQGDPGLAKCLWFNQSMLAIAIPCGLLAFLQHTLWKFLILFIVAMFTLFLVTAPVNACILTIVPPTIRPYAIAISVFLLHAVGDFPSPTFVGMLSDRFGRQCRLHTDEAACHANRSERCCWRPISHTDHAWQCWYEVQLRNALLITFSLLLVTLLCWNRVYHRVRARIGSAVGIPLPNEDLGNGTAAE